MNFYTYMHNHKVPNDKPGETEIDNYNCRNKDTCPLPNSCQTESKFIKPILTVTSLLDTNKNITLVHGKQYLKVVSGIIKSCSITLR